MLPQTRTCANPACRRPFTTTHPHQRYCHAAHRAAKGQHYTPAEKQQRKVLQQHPPNGHPCPRCQQPMTRQQWADGKLDTGHVIDRVLGGAELGLRWEHSVCGRSAGATLGNRLRTRATVRTSRAW